VLTGQADLAVLGGRAPTMETLTPDAGHFTEVMVLQAAFEVRAADRAATLPPGLHPTNPPLLIFLAWQVGGSPWGPFSMAQARVSCRSGVRPRGFVAGCVADSADAVAGLSSQWGLPARLGSVSLHRHYDATELVVSVDGVSACQVRANAPEPLGPGDVAYSVTMTLAHTTRGLRLVQLEPEYDLDVVERGRPQLVEFDGAVWGEPALSPVHPVSATVGTGSLTIPRLRFVCRPDVLAFEGTEAVDYP
jgi:hypothetical protein